MVKPVFLTSFKYSVSSLKTTSLKLTENSKRRTIRRTSLLFNMKSVTKTWLLSRIATANLKTNTRIKSIASNNN